MHLSEDHLFLTILYFSNYRESYLLALYLWYQIKWASGVGDQHPTIEPRESEISVTDLLSLQFSTAQLLSVLFLSALCSVSCTSWMFLKNFYLLVNIGSLSSYVMTERTQTSEIEREMVKMMTASSSQSILITSFTV